MTKTKHQHLLIILFIIFILLSSTYFIFQTAIPAQQNRIAIIHTNIGNITIQLLEDTAPQATQRFIQLINNDFYNGTIIHRIFPDLAIYGGQYLMNNTQKPYPYEPIPIETDPSIKHIPGTLSFLRSADDQTKIGCQFLICLDNITSLDGKNTIFAMVTDGMSLVQKISRYPHDDQYKDGSGRPMNPFDVYITDITLISTERT